MTGGRVRDYYRGETVLVTGFTGYLGKQLVEKLLWSCPELHRVYVLVRPKRTEQPAHRTKQVLQSLAFERVRAAHPERLEKVVGVAGDLTAEGLGLSEADRQLLQREVSVVLHAAASVRFDDPLPQAVEINVRASAALLALAKGMHRLKSYNHVSTAYVNCDRRRVEERLYPAKMHWRDLLKAVDTVHPSVLNVLSAKLLGVMPNTYVFTKSVAEHLVAEASPYLPLVITRPSIVTGAEREPLAGWVDTLNGPVGLAVGVAAGVIRNLLCHPDVIFDYIYSDYVVKGILVAATAPSDPLSEEEEVPVYHLCASPTHSTSMQEMMEIVKPAAEEHFSKLEADFLSFSSTGSPLWFSVSNLYKHLLSSYLLDALMRLAGHAPLLVKLRRRYHMAVEALKFFLVNTFHFDTSGFQAVVETVKHDEEFFIDLHSPSDKQSAARSSFFCVLQTTFLNQVFQDLSKHRKYLRALYYADKGAEYLAYTVFVFLLLSLQVPDMVFNSFHNFFLDLSFL